MPNSTKNQRAVTYLVQKGKRSLTETPTSKNIQLNKNPMRRPRPRVNIPRKFKFFLLLDNIGIVNEDFNLRYYDLPEKAFQLMSNKTFIETQEFNIQDTAKYFDFNLTVSSKNSLLRSLIKNASFEKILRERNNHLKY